MARGRPARFVRDIINRADQMNDQGERVNKSRIARELHCSYQTVWRVLAR